MSEQAGGGVGAGAPLVEIDAVEMTPTGIPSTDCETCHRRHPVTRKHCPTCGLAHLFPCTQTTAQETSR